LDKKPAKTEETRHEFVGRPTNLCLERFQAKWMPVRVKKTRKNKKLEHFHVSMKYENALAP
jgi:hypothetical protein